MMYRKIKSFFFFVMCFMGLGSLPLQALPERYHVVAQETPREFYFYEDQPWVSPPQKISFQDKLDTQKVIILHLWATSCPSCIAELKEIEKVSKEYAGKPIEFIVLSLNDPRSGVLRNYFSANHYNNLKPYHNASSKRPPIKGLPTTLFFNRSGKLIGRIEGPAKWQEEEMKRLLNRLIEDDLKKTPPPLKGFEGFIAQLKERMTKWFS